MLYKDYHVEAHIPRMPWCKKILPRMSQTFKYVLPKKAGIKGLCHQDINLILIFNL